MSASELMALVLLAATDEAPAPEDVVAGWTALLVFALLIGAVVFLGFSLSKQLRKAEAAKKAGVYGDPTPTDEASEPPTEPAPEPDSSSAESDQAP